MPDAPATHPSLLVRLGDPRDGAAWREFVDVYAPLVYGYLRRRGLQDADAADLTQDVLRSVCTAVGRLDYDPARGSFRGWLFTVVRNRLRNFRASGGRGVGTGGTSARLALEAVPDDAPEDEWQRDHECRLFAWAAERVKTEFEETTWRAFWRTAVDGVAAAAVARELAISVGAVYIARSRVLARLRDRIRAVEGD